MKRIVLLTLSTALIASLLAACTGAKNDRLQETLSAAETGDATERAYSDYVGVNARIAVQSGEIFNTVAQDVFKAGEVPEYTVMSSLLEALRLGKADAVLLSDGYIRQLQVSGMFTDFDYLPVPREIFVNEAAPVFHTEKLRDEYNAWFATIVADGTWQEAVERWIEAPNLPEEGDIPRFDLTGENGTLVMCGTIDYPPLNYVDSGGEVVGYDIEIMSRFALYMGMDLEMVPIAYEGVIPFVLSGKADMSSCSMAITDERGESVIFGLPSVITQAVLVVPKGNRSGLDYTDLAGKRLAVEVGSIAYHVSELIGAVPVYYQDVSSILEEIRNGRIDGYMVDYSYLRYLISSDGKGDMRLVEIPSEIHALEQTVIANKVKREMMDSFNEFLAEIKLDGTLSEMQNRWLEDIENVSDFDSLMPDIPLSDKNGIMRGVTSGVIPPFTFVGSDGSLMGYSIELARRFAAYMEMDVEFEMTNFDGLVPHVISGKSDFIFDLIAATEERRQSVLCSDSIYDDNMGVIVLAQTGAASPGSGSDFIRWLQTAIERNLLTDNRWKMVVDGLGVTMIIAILAQILGTAFGCFVCYVLTRKNRFVRWLGNLYCGLIHGTPVVVLLMITYYIIFGSSNISNVLIAVAAFTLVTGAGVAGNLKSAIDAVDPVEIEAARGIGFTAWGAFRAVTLPQAIRHALPGYTTGFVELVKATAIVGYVAIQDMMRAADIIRSRTYDAYFPLLFVAVIYLLMTAICVRLFKAVIRRLGIEN